MKYTSSALKTLLSKVKMGQHRAVLLYGPDKGMISYICSEIIKGSGKTASTISYKDAQNKGLDIVLNNASLFGDSEIIRIHDTPQILDDAFKTLLQHKIHNFPIFIANELSTTSSLRKFFESEDTIAACGCYPDDDNAVSQLIRQTVLESAKKITPDAVTYLTRKLGGDRLLIMNELGKLLLFTYDKNAIDLDDVIKITSSSLTTSPDKLCISFAKCDAKQYLEELGKLLAENVSPVWIIRAIVRYYINLYIVASHIERGISLDIAMQNLKPPVFFKHVADFRRIVTGQKTVDILRILRILESAEIACKSSSTSPETICELLFFKVYDTKLL
jgi:DNA polymerase-3 subunit delta